MLPKEFTVGLAETNETSEIDLGRITFDVACTVVGADINLAVSDDRVAIGLAAYASDPFDVLRIVTDPFTGPTVEAAAVPRQMSTPTGVLLR